MRKLSLASTLSHRASVSTATTDAGYVTARGRPSLSLSIDSTAPPVLSSVQASGAGRPRQGSSSYEQTHPSNKVSRSTVQTPATGSTVPTILQTPLTHKSRRELPSPVLVDSSVSPISPASPTSPRSPILGATNSIRNKLSASASWRWLSFGNAASVAEARADPVGAPPEAPVRSSDAVGSSRTRVSVQPSTNTLAERSHTPSPVRKARSASAAPSRHSGRSGSISLPASPALPRGQSYTSSRSSSGTTSNGYGQSYSEHTSSAQAVASRSSSLAYRQNSFPAPTAASQTSTPTRMRQSNPWSTASPRVRHVRSPTSLQPTSITADPRSGVGSIGQAPKDRQSVAPAPIMRAAEMEDVQMSKGHSKPMRPTRSRDRPAPVVASATLGGAAGASGRVGLGVSTNAKGLDAELGEVVERRKARLGRAGTVGGSSRSAR